MDRERDRAGELLRTIFNYFPILYTKNESLNVKIINKIMDNKNHL